jgi:hypothetical protein
MINSKDLAAPTKSKKDTVHSFVEGGLSGIPFGGGLAAKIFKRCIVSPYEKRFNDWKNTVTEKLNELLSSGLVKWEDLEGNERFLTVFIQCTQAAMRQHHEEKLNLLLNALSNTAQQNYIEEDLESTFVRYIDELSVTHFYLLTFLYENEKNLADINEYEVLLNIFIEDRKVQIGYEEFRLYCKNLEDRLLVRFSSNLGETNDVYEAPALLLAQLPHFFKKNKKKIAIFAFSKFRIPYYRGF